MENREVFGRLAEAILEGGVRKATKYISPTHVIKATRKVFRRRGGRERITEILFTVGKPNCEEREFIKRCQKSGEPFPVKRLLLKPLRAKG